MSGLIPSLPECTTQLREGFALSPVVAFELEFYLPTPPGDAFWRGLLGVLPIEKYEPERGAGQWEVALPPVRDVLHAVGQAEALKAWLAGQGADLRARPFANQPGSGLHVHVHLEDALGQPVYYKRDAEMSNALRHSIGGLLATLPNYLPVFAPSPESHARYQPGGGGPETISWGANNRTCAVRLPDAGAPHRHIEHRVAGADASPRAVTAAVLAGILHGLQHRLDPGPQTHGDAALPMYGLARISH